MFTPSAGDWTVQFLNHIFGMGWQTMYLNGGGGSQNVLASVMGSFNRIAFIVMALFYSYTAIISAYSTAHEGVALGKKYHWAYTPIRGMIGFGLLAPIGPNGLCLLQGLVLMFVYSGIGLADNLWGQTLTYLQAHGGSISTMSDEDPRDMANGVLHSLVIRDYLVQNNGLLASSASFMPSPCANNPLCASAAGGQEYIENFEMQDSGGGSAWIAPEALGSVSVWCPVAVAPAPNSPLGGQSTFDSTGYAAYCSSKQTATQNLINTLDQVAQSIVSTESTTSNPNTINAGIINTAIAQYQSDIGTAVATFSSSFNGPLAQDYASFVTTAQSQGWAGAGAWYLQIARVNDEVASSIGKVPTATGPNMSELSGASLGDIQPLMTTTDTIISLANGTGGYIQDEHSDSTASRSWIMRKIDSMFDGIKTGVADLETSLVTSMTSGQDPVSTLQSTGNTIDSIAATGATIAITASIIGHYATGDMPYQVAFGFIKLFFLPGMALAYLVPFIPFTIWTLAVVGWVILVIESWIAAPIWAIAHGMPEGEGFVGQHARQGYMLFFSVLFKPSLLIIGYFASILLLSVILPFVALGFGVFLHAQSAAEGIILFLIQAVAFFALFSALCLVIIKKCFNLITWVPDNILRWIGNNVQPLVSGAESSGVGRTGAVGAGVVGGAAGSLTSRISPAAFARRASQSEAQNSRQLTDEKNTAQRDAAIAQKERITGGGNNSNTGGGGGRGASTAGGGTSGNSLPDTPLTSNVSASNSSPDLGVKAPTEGTTEHPAKVEIPMDVLAQDEEQIASEAQSRNDGETTI